MPTPEESQLQTVPVIVTNFPSTKPTEDIEARLGKMYELFNGKDYKKRFEEIEKQVKAVQNSNTLIHTLLRTFLPSISANLGTISNNTKPRLSPSPTPPTGEGQPNPPTPPAPPSGDNSNPSNVNDIIDSLGTVSSDLRNSIESLRAILAELIQGINGVPRGDTGSPTPGGGSGSGDGSGDSTPSGGTHEATREAHGNAINASGTGGINSSSSEQEVTDKAHENARQIIEAQLKQQESIENAVQNAKKIISIQKQIEEDLESERKRTRNSLISVLQGILDTIKQNFHKVFESWDRQAAHLKEIGMGRESIIELNNITSDTMHATEDLVEWDVSIDKAIKATNDLVSAGFSPKYMRDNNRNLIMGLESAGLQLQPSTIRELGNAVFDATHVKELTQGWADLIAADTENRIDASELSRFLASDDYKKYISLAMSQGATREQADLEMQNALKEAIQWGATGKDAFNMAMMQSQSRLGGGAYLNIPENISSLIGMMQSLGTFSGDLKNFTTDFSKTVKEAQRNPEARRALANIGVGTAAGNDFTIYDNLLTNQIVNDSRRTGPLHIATHEQQEEGHDEGLLVRATKFVGNDLLGGVSRSMGAYSQYLTGDASYGTNFFTGLWNKFVPSVQDRVNNNDKKERYLKEIADNTTPMNDAITDSIGGLTAGLVGGGGTLTKILPILSGALPYIAGIAGIAAGVAVISGIVSNINKELENRDKAEKLRVESKASARESFENEVDLRAQLSDAVKKGDEERTRILADKLNKAEEITKRALLTEVLAENKRDESKYRAWGLGAAGSKWLAEYTNGDVDERVREKREQQEKEMGRYADGGVVTKEQIALVGENDNPELILPLTKPDRMNSLLEQVGLLSNRKVKDSTTYSTDISIVDIIKKQQSDVEKIANILQRKENRELGQSEDDIETYMKNMLELNIKNSGNNALSLASLQASEKLQSNFNSFVEEYRSNSLLPRKWSFFEEGGVVDSEQAAVVGENNKPEVILPLTNPVRTVELLREAANHPGTSKIVRDILNVKTNTPFAEINLGDVTNIQNGLDSVYATHPELLPFISYLDSSLGRLDKLSYKDQLSELKDNNIITQQEYNRVVEQNQDRLIDSLDSLNKTVQESNRMSRNSQFTPNLSSNINRRYV